MLSKTIKNRRKEIKLTQDEVAVLSKVSKDSVRRWESGEREPRASELKELAFVLKTSAAYLLGETDDPSPIPTFTCETLPAADPQPEPEAVAEPAPPTRTPAKIIENIASINGEIAETSGLFTDSEAKTAEMLLRLCIENLETEPAASSEQETAS